MKKLLPSLPALLILIFLTGCTTTGKFIRYTIPEITDVNIFPTQIVHKSQEPFSFFKTENQELPDMAYWVLGKPKNAESLEEFFKKTGTTAFLVIRNDTLLYENYFNGYTGEELSQVFSITKSVLSALVGIAIKDGFIKSVYQPVSDFIPEFAERGRDRLTINNLLQMTAGLSSADYQTPAKLLNMYYSGNQENLVKKMEQKYIPGTRFAYSSAASQVLGMCLEKAVGMKVPAYLEEKLWMPLGMERDARFALEKEGGAAKMYGGLAAAAIDLAKLGRLYLNNGNWNGEQLIPENWVKESRMADTIEGRSTRYAYCWWLDTYPRTIGYCDNDFFAGGYRGQVLYVNPNDNTIMVRLGKRESGIDWPRSLSKLALLKECESNSCGPMDFLTLEGNYKNKYGKSFALRVLNDMLVLEDDERHEKVELRQEGSNKLVNKQKGFKITVDYKNQRVRGIFVEGHEKEMFFQKI